MSDRTSTEFFSELFTILDEARATAPGRIVKKLALRVWEMSWDDFAPEQLCCDEALAHLGLARPAAPGRPREYASRDGKFR